MNKYTPHTKGHRPGILALCRAYRPDEILDAPSSYSVLASSFDSLPPPVAVALGCATPLLPDYAPIHVLWVSLPVKTILFC